MRSIKSLLFTSSIVLVGACANTDIANVWSEEAGVFLNRTGFGQATLNNRQYQNGERNYVVELNDRFSNEVLTTVNFAFNSSKLDQDAAAILKVQADWINQFPEVKFKVYGHTDAVGTASYNKRLGMRRARSVVNFLVSRGVDRRRLEAAVSLGESQPIIVSQNRERLNRRTVTEVTGFLTGREDLLNGKYAEIIFREYVESATEAPPSTESGLSAIAAQGG